MEADPLVVVLQEYEERDIHLTLAQAQTLRRLCRDKLTLQPGDAAQCWRLMASSHVGTIVTPDVRVLIRPKVSIANLFYLLEADGQPLAVDEAIFEYQRTSDLVPSFATFFARHLDVALGKGVPRSYVELEQLTMGVRGRAADLQTRIAFTRLTAHCRPAEQLARVVLGGSSLLDDVGATGAAVFLLDMNRVFEDFVGSRLRRYLAGRLQVHEQHRDCLDVDGSVSIRPDLLFDTPAGVRAYVADCKYKLSTDGLGRTADYYQLHAYATALNLREGLLIYCRNDGQTPPREVRLRYGGVSLRTWLVRLDEAPAAIEGELRRLAEEITSRTVVGAGLHRSHRG